MTTSTAKCPSHLPSRRSVVKWRCRPSGQGSRENSGRNAGRPGFQIARQRDRQCEGRERGDLLARVLVEIPTKLNGEQRQKLEEFSALCDEENTPLHKSFFDRAKDFFR